MALHDPALALNFCDRLLLLSDGGVLDILTPESTPLAQMEQALSAIYGNISLQRCSNRAGRSYLVMLREDA